MAGVDGAAARVSKGEEEQETASLLMFFSFLLFLRADYSGLKIQSSSVTISGPMCSTSQASAPTLVASCSTGLSISYESDYDSDCASFDEFDCLPELVTPTTAPTLIQSYSSRKQASCAQQLSAF